MEEGEAYRRGCLRESISRKMRGGAETRRPAGGEADPKALAACEANELQPRIGSYSKVLTSEGIEIHSHRFALSVRLLMSS